MSWVVAHAEVHISVLECEEPEVQVLQAPRLAIWRSQPALVEASVDLKGCLRYGARYLWQLLSAPSCDPGRRLPSAPVPLPAEVDVRRLQLWLPKMVLPAGSYALVFSLSYASVPLKKAACLQLSVMSARSVEEPTLTLPLLRFSTWVDSSCSLLMCLVESTDCSFSFFFILLFFVRSVSLKRVK